jgi:hypothetical protein
MSTLCLLHTGFTEVRSNIMTHLLVFPFLQVSSLTTAQIQHTEVARISLPSERKFFDMK